MIETFRMLGREREADLVREAERLHRLGRRRRGRLRIARPAVTDGAARKRALFLVRDFVRVRG